MTNGSFSEGASTITQQLIKNQVFTEWTTERTFLDRMRRKVQEQYLAIQLEKTKQQGRNSGKLSEYDQLRLWLLRRPVRRKALLRKGCLRPHPLRMRRTRRDPRKSIRLQSCFFSGSKPPSPAHYPQLYGSTGPFLVTSSRLI